MPRAQPKSRGYKLLDRVGRSPAVLDREVVAQVVLHGVSVDDDYRLPFDKSQHHPAREVVNDARACAWACA